MASSYPGSVDSFTTKTDKEDLYAADHMNEVQNSIIAIQTELGTDPAGTLTDLKSRLAIMMATNGAIANGTSFPVSPSPVDGQEFYRTDENILYIYDGSAWQSLGSASIDVYGTSGSPHTFSVPTGVTEVLVFGCGGGASGAIHGSGGGGGGAGGWIRGAMLSVSGSETITIGAGGAGAASTPGNDGGDTTITHDGGTLTLPGGSAGSGTTGGAAGGTRTSEASSDYDASGSTGGSGNTAFKGGAGANGASSPAGGGGGCPFGEGSDGGTTSGTNNAGIGAGSGGASNGLTGTGGDGIVILMYNVPLT